jgi:glycosyltransferase involved in cell wall biosynthesis
MQSICFVNSDNYPVLNPEYGSRYIGGESVQQTLLAREFARQGWRVSMVCEDFGQPDGEVIDGIRIWKTFRTTEGIHVIRYVYPRLYRIWKALGKADADIYYQSCAGAMTGFVAKFCRQRNRRMVFRLAHDTDCIPGQQLIRFARDRKIYEWGMRRADWISAQSDVQQDLLAKNYRLESTITNMAVEIPDLSKNVEKDIDVLWVNNLRDFKRPDVLCEIAARMPDVNFVMIGGQVAGHESLHAGVEAAAKKLPNLSYIGAVPYHEVNEYFLRAKVFLNTSDSEGFPNSFLQAWVREVPVISFFDPDSIIGTREFGVSPDSQDQARAAIRRLLGSEEVRKTIGTRAREYVAGKHSPAAVVREYISWIA